ncbi:MAG: hypothetical protein U0Q12_18125 [Vicinamibacterales bacterium]
MPLRHAHAAQRLEDAFLAFGGVPREVLFDQMKAVTTRDLRLQGGALVHNLEFLRFAHHWGFTPRACRPYRAQAKGKVERPVRYVRGNLVYGRTELGRYGHGQGPRERSGLRDAATRSGWRASSKGMTCDVDVPLLVASRAGEGGAQLEMAVRALSRFN